LTNCTLNAPQSNREILKDPKFFRVLDAGFLAGNPIVNWSYEECRDFVAEAVATHATPSMDLVAANTRLVFWEAYKNIDQVSSFPYTVAFPLTDVCNARCQFCAYIPERVFGRETGIAEFKQLTWLKFVSNLNLNCGLGEPLMHPDFAEIIQFLKRTAPHLKMDFTTNASLLNDANIAAIVNYIRVLKVSLNATRKESYERIMKIKWEPTIDGLKRLVERKAAMNTKFPIVRLSFVLHRHNIEEIAEAPALARELGCDSILLLNMTTLSKRWSDRYDRLLTAEDCIENCQEIAIPALRAFKDECVLNGIGSVGHVPLIDDLPKDFDLSDTGSLTSKELRDLLTGNIKKRERTALDESFKDHAENPTVDPADVNLNKGAIGHENDKCKASFSSGFVRQVVKGFEPTCIDPWKSLRVGIRDDVAPCCSFFGGIPNFDWRYASADKFHDLKGTWNSPPLKLLRQTMNRPPQEASFCTSCRTDRKQDPSKRGLFTRLKQESLRRVDVAYEGRFKGTIRDGDTISGITVNYPPSKPHRTVFRRQVHEYRRIVEVNGMRLAGHVMMLGADEALTPFFAECNDKLTVVDKVYRSSIQQLADYFALDNVHLVRSKKLSNLSLDAQSVDAVWLCGPAVMGSDRDRLITEISRVLKPGGFLTLNGYQGPGRVVRRYAFAKLNSQRRVSKKILKAIARGSHCVRPGNFADHELIRRVLLKNKLRIREEWGHTFGKVGQKGNNLLKEGYKALAKRLASDTDLLCEIKDEPDDILAGIADYISLRAVKSK
jgi:MoaA/NifB/PqqE/SkfB family radical SAM enzyme/SAM-dependent methyltransferase